MLRRQPNGKTSNQEIKDGFDLFPLRKIRIPSFFLCQGACWPKADSVI